MILRKTPGFPVLVLRDLVNPIANLQVQPQVKLKPISLTSSNEKAPLKNDDGVTRV